MVLVAVGMLNVERADVPIRTNETRGIQDPEVD